MKITCDRELLSTAFHTAAMVAPAKSPKSILQNVKIDALKDQVTLMATDMEVGIRLTVRGVAVETPGSAVLPVGRFGMILRESSDEQLHIEADVQGIRVHGLSSEFKLPSQNPDEFPSQSIVTFEENKYHKLTERLLRELIRRTIFATDAESSRYALGGVLFEMHSDKIITVGTDGRRLAKMEGSAESCNGHETGETTTIIPTRSLQVIDRALSDLDAEVLIAVRSNDVLVKTPQATIYTRLVEGRFPKWRDVFPVRHKAIQVEMNVGPLYSAVRQAAIVADDETRGLDFAFGNGQLVMSVSTADVGQARVELPIPYDAEPITVTLDNRFVADFLKVLDPERTFTLEIENDEAAALFSTDDGYGYVVMPLARER
jgi:DNA polymerase-3 subunit beta